jgi:hypothetical protein
MNDSRSGFLQVWEVKSPLLINQERRYFWLGIEQQEVTREGQTITAEDGK